MYMVYLFIFLAWICLKTVHVDKGIMLYFERQFWIVVQEKGIVQRDGKLSLFFILPFYVDQVKQISTGR